MGFRWESAGRFRSSEEADAWCRRQGIAVTDSKLVAQEDGVELLIRASEVDEDDRMKHVQWPASRIVGPPIVK